MLSFRMNLPFMVNRTDPATSTGEVMASIANDGGSVSSASIAPSAMSPISVSVSASKRTNLTTVGIGVAVGPKDMSSLGPVVGDDVGDDVGDEVGDGVAPEGISVLATGDAVGGTVVDAGSLDPSAVPGVSCIAESPDVH